MSVNRSESGFHQPHVIILI